MARVMAAIDGGMTIEVMIAIIEETAGAPAPSWRYCETIITRCAAEGVQTMVQWDARRRARGSSSRTNGGKGERPGLVQRDYSQQHHYDAGQLDRLFVNWDKVQLDGGQDA